MNDDVHCVVGELTAVETRAGSHVYGPITGTWPRATVTSMSFTAQLRQLLFFGQTGLR